MTRDGILSLCTKACDVGSVKHTDFIDYVVVLEGHRKVNGEWQTTEHAYMTIDGKLAMANLDHRQQNKRLDFGEPKVLADTADQLTLLVTVTSEMYGIRHGIATSRKKTGTNAEKEWAWEVVETSATGRALAAMGYGLLPGAGLASAEDIIRSGAKDMIRAEAVRPRSELKTASRNGNGNGNGNGNHVCATHHIAMEQSARGWAHRLKGGSLCYGPRNGSITTPVAPGNHSAAPASA